MARYLLNNGADCNVKNKASELLSDFSFASCSSWNMHRLMKSPQGRNHGWEPDFEGTQKSLITPTGTTDHVKQHPS